MAFNIDSFISSKDWLGLAIHLDSLSNAQFRLLGNKVGEDVVPSLNEADAWLLIRTFVEHNSKAYLVTMLKAIVRGIENDTLHLCSEGGILFLKLIAKNPIDVQKTLLRLLPLQQSPDDLLWLFKTLNVEHGWPRIQYLVRCQSMPAAYVLYSSLKYVEADRALLLRIVRFLIQRGDGLSFNLASLIRTYYGLEEVKGTFSLSLQPYQLSRIETNYEAFSECMRR